MAMVILGFGLFIAWALTGPPFPLCHDHPFRGPGGVWAVIHQAIEVVMLLGVPLACLAVFVMQRIVGRRK